ncbi:hypothetical protein O3G_MSEX013247 [Manduca sexta]|uniref:Uncharacterized protein n=1 Tax=Manduca sexta TaxID=7130 RepID=A0A922CY83_MANSE|nr:hypothetical protein O3G_MSEX013247 [Manduca sexta]
MAENKNDDGKSYNPFVMDSIPKFTGDDVTYSSAKWVQDLDDNAEIFGWNQQQKLIIARRCLSGTAELWLRTEKPLKTFDELKAALIKEFPETVNSKKMHEMMSRRKKLPNETYYQYMLVMKDLGKRAKFPHYVSIQYIIDGIHDYESNKIMFYGVTTYPVLREKLNLYESCKEKTKDAKLRDKSVRPRTQEPEVKSVVKRCYKCGEQGHVASSCSRGIKCFKCNEFGHIGKECKMAAISHNRGACGGRSDVKFKRPDRRSMFVHYACDGDSCQCQCQHRIMLNVNNHGSVINKSVKCVRINEFIVNGLIDTGSDLNLIKFELFTKLNCEYQPDKILLTGLGSCQVFSVGKFDTDLVIDHHKYRINFYIVPTNTIPYDVILGQSFLVNTITVIDKGSVEVRPQSYDESYQHSICLSSSLTDNNPCVQDIINNYKPHKIKEAPIKLKIVLKDDIPVTQRPRRLAIAEEKVVNQQIGE